MKYYHHFIISLAAGALFLMFKGEIITFHKLLPWIFGGILADLDHYLTYSKKTNSFSFKRILRLIIEDYHTNTQHFYIFHTIEFAIFFALIVVSFQLSWQYYWAYLLHLAIDGVRHIKTRRNLLWLKKWSLAYYIKTSL